MHGFAWEGQSGPATGQPSSLPYPRAGALRAAHSSGRACGAGCDRQLLAYSNVSP